MNKRLHCEIAQSVAGRGLLLEQDLGCTVTPHRLWGKDGGPGGVHHQSDVPL